MKKLLLIACACAALAACTSTPAPMVEAGYPAGSLALAAIERGDWTTAERLLTTDSRIAADDPARLVNLGKVYMATGPHRRGARRLAARRRRSGSRSRDARRPGRDDRPARPRSARPLCAPRPEQHPLTVRFADD